MYNVYDEFFQERPTIQALPLFPHSVGHRASNPRELPICSILGRRLIRWTPSLIWAYFCLSVRVCTKIVSFSLIPLMHLSVDPGYWDTGTPGRWAAGPLGHQNTGTPEHHTGTPTPVCRSPLVCSSPPRLLDSETKTQEKWDPGTMLGCPPTSTVLWFFIKGTG